MSDQDQGAIHVGGSISGTGIAVGHGSSANVTISQGDRSQIAGILSGLREDLQRCALPDSTKKVLIEQTVPEIETAMQEADPRPNLENALAKANLVLESVGATAEQAGGVIEKLQKLAGHAGIAFAAIAPFAAKLLGQ